VVAHKVQERLALDELPGETDGMAVAPRLLLFNEMKPAGMLACRLGISLLVAGHNDEANAVYAGGDDFFEDDPQSCFLNAIAVHEGLQGQVPLVATTRGDDGFADIHGMLPVEEITASISKALPDWQPPITSLESIRGQLFSRRAALKCKKRLESV
jgi:hypothetical protein